MMLQIEDREMTFLFLAVPRFFLIGSSERLATDLILLLKLLSPSTHSHGLTI